MITIYILTYNEEKIIEFTVKHYWRAFPSATIVICDNESTDSTVEIAQNLGCTVLQYNTNDKLNDAKYLEIKNNWWKDAETDWVLVCDADELCQFDEEFLWLESTSGTTVVRFEGYDMVSKKGESVEHIRTGVRSPNYDKYYLFNRKKIKEINYSAGAHQAFPTGHVVLSGVQYKCLHYRFLSPEYTIERYKLFASRLSDDNKKNGWGWHYNQEEKEIKLMYASMRKNLIKLW